MAATGRMLAAVLVAVASSAPSTEWAQEPLAHDDECDAIAEPASSCAWHALQRQAARRTTVAQEVSRTASTCQGPWCPCLEDFMQMFDTNKPHTVQEAVDKHAEYATYAEGIRVAVTKNAFYEMYHGNVARKLQEYLPQHLFEWRFNKELMAVAPTNETEATVTRNGTITFNLGWWKRSMFWNYAVKTLPKGMSFPYSEVEKFDDCQNCPAKMVFRLMKGGLTGDESKGWKIVALTLIKLQ